MILYTITYYTSSLLVQNACIHIRICNINHGYVFGSGHMHRKLPLASVFGSYICGIHQVTMIHIIYVLIAGYEDANFYIYDVVA